MVDIFTSVQFTGISNPKTFFLFTDENQANLIRYKIKLKILNERIPAGFLDESYGY